MFEIRFRVVQSEVKRSIFRVFFRVPEAFLEVFTEVFLEFPRRLPKLVNCHRLFKRAVLNRALDVGEALSPESLPEAARRGFS